MQCSDDIRMSLTRETQRKQNYYHLISLWNLLVWRITEIETPGFWYTNPHIAFTVGCIKWSDTHKMSAYRMQNRCTCGSSKRKIPFLQGNKRTREILSEKVKSQPLKVCSSKVAFNSYFCKVFRYPFVKLLEFWLGPLSTYGFLWIPSLDALRRIDQVCGEDSWCLNEAVK